MNDKNVTKQQTESERILVALDYKIDALAKTADGITSKITTLGGFENLPSEPEEGKKSPQQGGNFISELDVRIERLHKLVDFYTLIYYNLERLA